MPEALRDLKHALRDAIAREFPSLRALARAARISPDTASNAVNGRVVPTRATVNKIRAACGDPKLTDGKYGGSWRQLYWAAALTQPVGTVTTRAPRRSGGPAAPVAPTRRSLPGGDHYEATRDALDRYHAQALDRDADLVDLLERLQGAPGYHIVTGTAFAGKTAVVVELYRRLRRLGWPVCAFYVMHGFQDRADQFLRAVTGQLLATLGRVEPLAGGDELVAQYQRLWPEFAGLGTAAAPAVLLVDGLDEQSVAEPISPLLPFAVPGHAAVLVSTRPSPDHRPGVPPFHPLASDPTSAVRLGQSPHARITAAEAERHLRDFLEAGAVHGEIAGLLALAGAPLTRTDIGEILHLGPGEVGACLRQVARCVLPITGADGTPGYQWAHEQYNRYVDAFLGHGQHRDRIVERILHWSDRYAERLWPSTTPPYLLAELPRFLAGSAREDRMQRLFALTDDHRRRAIRGHFGHDRPFLEVLDLIRAELSARPADGRDLRQLFRVELLSLVVNSSVLFLPDGFLTVLVGTGRAEQARGLALCMEEKERASALAEISMALDRADPAAAALAAEATAYAEALPADDYRRDRSRCDALRAVHLATGIVPPLDWAARPAEREQGFLCAVADLHADLGRTADAWSLVREVVSSGTEHLHGWVLADLSGTAATLGDLDLALSLARKAVARPAVLGPRTARRLQSVVTRLTSAGRPDDAGRITEAITGADHPVRAMVETAVCRALATRGEHEAGRAVLDAALAKASDIRHGPVRALSLAHLAGGMAALGHRAEAARLVESLLIDPVLDRDDDNNEVEQDALTELAAVCLELGEPERAREVCARVLRVHVGASTPFLDEWLVALTSALIAAGRPEQAAAVLPAIRNRAHRVPVECAVTVARAAAGTSPAPGTLHWSAQDRIQLAGALVAGGRPTDARHLVEQVLASVPDAGEHLLRPAFEVLYSSGGPSAALTAAGRIGHLDGRARTFARLASLCSRAGDEQAARTFGTDAVRAALRIRNRATRLGTLCAVVELLGSAPVLRPYLDRAVTAARALAGTTAATGILLLARLSVACLRAGCPEAGLPLAREVAAAASGDPWQAFEVIECLGRAGMTEELGKFLGNCAGDFFAFLAAAEVCTEVGAWTEAAGFARVAVTHADELHLNDTGTLHGLIVACGHAGEITAAQELVARYGGWDETQLLAALVGALVEGGHAGPALEVASAPSMYTRTAGLVAWAVSPAWPSPMREELLELLLDRVLDCAGPSAWEQ